VKPVLSPDLAMELDRATQASGVPATLLMDRAGRTVARACVDLMGGTYGRRAVVVVGKGNNGGDGLVAARQLAAWGVRVAVLSVEPLEALRDPAAEHLGRLAEAGLHVRTASPATLERELGRADIAVDAIFGTGFRGIPEGDWAAAIEGLNAGAPPVVAVDIPSGVNGATGAVEGDAVAADLTVTFGAAKIGAVLLPGAERAGTVRVVDIGFSEDLMRSIPRRAVDGHKRESGVLLVVAGSRGMTGAPALIASAAARIGAGLVIVAVPLSALQVVQGASRESVFLPLPETADGTVAAAALQPVLEALDRAHALAIGPGLTAQSETAGFVRDLVAASPVPLVVDADGLNAFAANADLLADRKAEAVLTPHVGEFGRLTGTSAHDLARDRLAHVRSLATRSNAVALLKGSRTIVAAPDGTARVNVTGSPVLATAGSGDVLTGMVGGLLARGVSPFDAASSAAYLHGSAGTLAGSETGEGTLAGDLVRRIPDAVAWISEPA
jgi:hydroxyethylthiazole kinase-like uncharacterized protein yjeF